MRQYLKDTKKTAADLARDGDFDAGQLSRWLRGIRRPGLDNAERLELHTLSAVPAVAWSNLRARAKRRSA